tara:strand:- start:820 stop:3363 length:2544 start_codon:yes stop_codon:yes gene_type:complete
MNKYFLIIGIIIILLNKNVTIDKKALYLGFFILSMKYLKRNKDFIDKTFLIDLKTNQLFTNLLGETIKSILLTRGWKELENEDLKSIDKIGLVFSNTYSKNILKSQINYRVYTQNSEIFTNKIYFSENFKDTQFFPKYSVLDRLSIIDNIEKLYQLISTLKKNKNAFFVIKDPYGSLGKEIFIFDDTNKTNSYKKKIKIYLNGFKSKYILIEEFLDSIKFKVPELSFNYQKINFETEFGRRSIIRFFICIILKEGKIYIYKINSLLINLAVLPSQGSVKLDLSNFGKYITNFYNGSKKVFKDNLSESQNLNVELYNKLLNSENIDIYQKELYTKLFALSSKEFKRQFPKKYKIYNESLNDFIIKFGDKYKDELMCKNYKCFNKNFESCFNIFAIDTILTTDNEFKVLEINTNPSTIVLKYFNRFNKIYNTKDVFNNIFNILENKKYDDSIIELKYTKSLNYSDKTYYLSLNQVKTYPEIVNSLKKRNYMRSINRISRNLPIDLYLGYIIRNTDLIEDDKELYLEYLGQFLENYNITNKISEAIFELGDKSMLYNHLRKSGIIPDFVNFKIYKDQDNINYIKTRKLLEVQNFVNSNITPCSRFILKPSLGSQGDGIQVIKYYEQFIEWYKKENIYSEWSISEFLIPKTLISRKLKDNHPRKVHIRSYFILVKHINNKIKIYELVNRVIYFAVDKYIDKCVNVTKNNKYSFITNLALASEERNINYDTSNYTDDLLNYQDQIFNFKKLSNKITEYALKCIDLINSNELNCFNKDNINFKGCYQILALDYLPVGKNDLKLLEVNRGPGFKALKVNFNLEEIFDEIFSVTIDKFNGYSVDDSKLKLLKFIN